MTIRVLVNGAPGKMGQEVVNAVNNDPELTLVGESDKNHDLNQVIGETNAEVVVDFTNAASGFKNTEQIIAANAHPVIGTSGFNAEQVDRLSKQCTEKQLGGIIAPNFSIGAVLLMQYAAEISHYFPDLEIIELHHDQKLDAPSGTSIKTAEMIAEKRGKSDRPKVKETELYEGARGATVEGVKVHSVRLPGFIAHEMVIFGGHNETLTMRHDSIHRSSFMPGVVLACKKVKTLNKLVYGLEHIL